MKNTKSATILILSLLIVYNAGAQSQKKTNIKLFEADNSNIQYTGRIDFNNIKKPRFWAPGVYIKAKFRGSSCEIIINDQELLGKSHNYLEIAVDDAKPFKIQTTAKSNTIKVAKGLSKRGTHNNNL